ncbi:hypothetical protein CGRA01v4_10703 [Colletotrichum graminicola]|uniref:Uncharacterized protein n=1 Tax=Colletotrichum graminicola (strain M1.001 / M2 / FGSC 10212) TaxID=645133 RepID=E3QZQ9_COLGM|nr:uncharacterized protein GLRG_11492 [Colletotrichum graminicola M1.001]EFQ36347.1 hypothetical protein GLRG_11492 [Colletotrichum graminicola M1.001]WDK19416.1 hypothetical protein CGRA01v4_10703 [Colletotrichum graminicola]
MAKQSSKQTTTFNSENSSSKTSGGQSAASSTVPVDRSWQYRPLGRGQAVTGGSGSYCVGRWLTEPSWQEPFNTIAEVPAAGSEAGQGVGGQGSGASATCATSRTQKQQQQQH